MVAVSEDNAYRSERACRYSQVLATIVGVMREGWRAYLGEKVVNENEYLSAMTAVGSMWRFGFESRVQKRRR